MDLLVSRQALKSELEKPLRVNLRVEEQEALQKIPFPGLFLRFQTTFSIFDQIIKRKSLNYLHILIHFKLMPYKRLNNFL